MQTADGSFFYLFRAEPYFEYGEEVAEWLKDDEYANKVGYDGEFVYGYYNGDYMLGEDVKVTDEYYSPEWWLPIRRQTLGVFIGRHDSKSRRVFEGDILAETVEGVTKYHEVKYDKTIAGFKPFCGEKELLLSYEVVGNIYNDYHLLEKGC